MANDLRRWFYGTVLVGASVLLCADKGGIERREGRGLENGSFRMESEEKNGARISRINTDLSTLVGGDGKKAKMEELADSYAVDYGSMDLREMRDVLYGEAANQSRRGRKLVGRTILNRVFNSDYPNSIIGVIHQKNAFSYISDKKNKNWRQLVGEEEMNGYDKMIYGRCSEDARGILEGEVLGVARELEIVAYHDVSVKYEDLVAKEKIKQEKLAKKGKRYDGFWMKLGPVAREGRLIFYAPKKD